MQCGSGQSAWKRPHSTMPAAEPQLPSKHGGRIVTHHCVTSSMPIRWGGTVVPRQYVVRRGQCMGMFPCHQQCHYRLLCQKLWLVDDGLKASEDRLPVNGRWEDAEPTIDSLNHRGLVGFEQPFVVAGGAPR